MIKKKLINISYYILIIIILLSQTIKADDLFSEGKKIRAIKDGTEILKTILFNIVKSKKNILK